MKFNARDLTVLKNFASINPSIQFKEGNVIRTISRSKTILASAKLSEEVEKTFAVYDLSQFLSAMSLFSDPEIDFGESSLTIRQGKEKLQYTYTDASLINTPPNKDINLPSEDVSFELKNEVLTKVQKALGVVGSPEVAFIGDGETIRLTACDSKNSSSSNFSIDVGETEKTFKLIFLAENIKLLPGDYQVTSSAKGISKFENDEVTYFIASEQNSTFED